jgi:PEP-CTERM motif
VRLRAFLAAAVVLAMATSAQAVQLVVMAVNANPGVAGAKAFTIGVQITAADIAANPDSTLFVQNISFTGAGSAVGPIQAGNTPDIQTAWTLVDSASPNSIGNGGSGGPSFPTSGGATTALYKDSWWYSGGTATLQGINGFLPDQSNDTFGTVTTVNSGQGVYAQGPGANVGATGYLFQPEATGITGGVTTGSTMGFSGLFGPLGGNVLDQAPLSSQLVGGILTVPLAQIITKGDIQLPDTYQAGTGQFLAVGGTAYNLNGTLAGPGLDPNGGNGGILNFATGQIVFGPEPGTFVLAGMGALGMFFAWRRRKS